MRLGTSLCKPYGGCLEISNAMYVYILFSVKVSKYIMPHPKRLLAIADADGDMETLYTMSTVSASDRMLYGIRPNVIAHQALTWLVGWSSPLRDNLDGLLNI